MSVITLAYSTAKILVDSRRRMAVINSAPIRSDVIDRVVLSLRNFWRESVLLLTVCDIEVAM